MAITNGQVANADEVNAIMSPVGAVIAWLKSYTNTPALSTSWVECNGQTLSDAESVYNGQTIPNLNGSVGGALKGRYLRGDTTSGSTQNDDVKPHTHTYNTGNTTSGGTGAVGFVTGTNATSENSGSETRPYTYTVVWIMRVK